MSVTPQRIVTLWTKISVGVRNSVLVASLVTLASECIEVYSIEAIAQTAAGAGPFASLTTSGVGSGVTGLTPPARLAGTEGTGCTGTTSGKAARAYL